METLLHLNPDAPHVGNSNGFPTPFEVALQLRNDFAIDLLQWKLTLDEIEGACDESLFVRRFVPLVKEQLEPLVTTFLPQDVAGIVERYLFLPERPSPKRLKKPS